MAGASRWINGAVLASLRTRFSGDSLQSLLTG